LRIFVECKIVKLSLWQDAAQKVEIKKHRKFTFSFENTFFILTVCGNFVKVQLHFKVSLKISILWCQKTSTCPIESTAELPIQINIRGSGSPVLVLSRIFQKQNQWILRAGTGKMFFASLNLFKLYTKLQDQR
jgi:hypothetical protein